MEVTVNKVLDAKGLAFMGTEDKNEGSYCSYLLLYELVLLSIYASKAG
jgi:hypothetical protein